MTLITDFTFTGHQEVSCKYMGRIIYTEFTYSDHHEEFDFFETNVYNHNGDPDTMRHQELNEVKRQLTRAIFESPKFEEIENDAKCDPVEVAQQWREDEMMGN